MAVSAGPSHHLLLKSAYGLLRLALAHFLKEAFGRDAYGERRHVCRVRERHGILQGVGPNRRLLPQAYAKIDGLSDRLVGTRDATGDGGCREGGCTFVGSERSPSGREEMAHVLVCMEAEEISTGEPKHELLPRATRG